MATPSTPGQNIAGEMDKQVQAGKGDNRRQRNGCPAEPAVGFGQHGRADSRGQHVAGGERVVRGDRKSTRLNSSHWNKYRMPSSA